MIFSDVYINVCAAVAVKYLQLLYYNILCRIYCEKANCTIFELSAVNLYYVIYLHKYCDDIIYA